MPCCLLDNLLRYPPLIEADLQEAHARFGAADSLRPGRVCGTFMIESRGSKGVVRGDQAYGGLRWTHLSRHKMGQK